MDRFIIDDKENCLKLQPDYVVYYKFSNDYEKSDIFQKSLNVAKDFKIPIVVIDVLKVKENEKKEIKLLEEELFLRDKCDKDLLNSIVVRYMNNYTGALVMMSSKSVNYKEDFSVKGMEDFFDKLLKKIEKIDDSRRKKEWIDDLEEVYFDEMRKFKNAKRVRPFSCSVSNFIFKRYNLKKKIDCLKKGLSFNNLENESKLSITTVLRSGEVIAYSNIDGIYRDRIGFRISGLDCAKSIIKVNEHNDVEIFLLKDQCSSEIKSILDFNGFMYCEKGAIGSILKVGPVKKISGLPGIMIHCDETKCMEKLLIENLVVSYFFESQDMIIDDLICHDFDCDISFNCSDDFDFVKLVMDSPSYKCIFKKNTIDYINLDSKQLNISLEMIENMSNESFLNIFLPVIKNYSFSSGKEFEDVAATLLDKKKNIRNEFNRLQNILNKKKDSSFDCKKRIYD